MTRPTVAVNGRFLGVPVTGVQRYAHELVRRLPGAWDGDVEVVAPGAPTQRLAAGDPLPPGVRRLQGVAGHAWEQGALSARFLRSDAAVLFSPASWGPVAVRRQLLFVHDLGPLLHPDLYVPQYVRMSKALLPALLRTSHGIVTSCDRGRVELHEAGVADERIHVVPPGVAAPFTTVDPVPAGDYCAFVGGTDRRKNLPFVLDFWPRVHQELGLELRVVQRAGTTTRAHEAAQDTEGVVVVHDPDDRQLAELLAGSLCLLWASRYEGYGLPMLEAMATGAPFISTDTGAARELAVEPDQVQPLEGDRWVEVLRRWREDGAPALRARSLERGRAMTWERSTEALCDGLAATIARGRR